MKKKDTDMQRVQRADTQMVNKNCERFLFSLLMCGQCKLK